MIKEILAILMILSIAGFASADRNFVNVETPVYEDSDLVVTWSYGSISPYGNVGLHVVEQYNDGNLNEKYFSATRNDGSETILNGNINGGLVVYHNYFVIIGRGHNYNGAVATPFTIEESEIPDPDPVDPDPVDPDPVDPIPVVKDRAFFGYTFGTSHCNRMAILMGQPPNRHANYTMEVISWDYKYNVTEMIKYCERCGANMTPIVDGFYTWNP